MDRDLQAMWAFLAVGTFVLISMIMLNIAGLIAALPQTWFVIGTALVVAFSCAMYVAAFVAAVDYMKVQLKRFGEIK